MSKHTALPWKTSVRTDLSHGPIDIVALESEPQEFIAKIVLAGGAMNYKKGKANAEFIVHCVNSHDDLLEALERIAETFHGLSDAPDCLRHLFRECPNPHCRRAQAAIAKAKS